MTLLWLCVANVGSPTRCMCILYELTTLQLFLVIGIVMRRSWDDEINVYIVGQSLRRCSDSGNCYRFYQLVSWCYFCDLIVPHVQTQRYVSRSFRVSGPTVWNSHKTYEAVTFPGNSSSVDLRHGCLSMLMCRWRVWEFFIEDALYKFTFWFFFCLIQSVSVLLTTSPHHLSPRSSVIKLTDSNLNSSLNSAFFFFMLR